MTTAATCNSFLEMRQLVGRGILDIYPWQTVQPICKPSFRFWPGAINCDNATPVTALSGLETAAWGSVFPSATFAATEFTSEDDLISLIAPNVRK